MVKYFLIAVVSCFVLGQAAARENVSGMKITRLRCEYLVNPLGIDERAPRLSWELVSARRGEKQTAYRILVASSRKKLNADEGDLWDSGKVMSDRTNQVEYEGAPLASRMRCYWKVCVWDGEGNRTEFSEPAFWTMGLLSNSDWKAEWIAMKPKGDPSKLKPLEPGPPPPWFRKTFALDKPVKRAFVYVTARGLFELSLNGKKVGEDVFAPGWTDYNKRIMYRTYDVTAMVRRGGNAIGAVVGDGWYSGYIGWRKVRGNYGFVNSLLLQLEVEFEDGTSRVIATDGSWKCSEGPIVSSDFMQGETYDARLEMPGWDTPDFDDTGWEPVITVEKPSARLVSQPSEPVRVTEYITPVSVSEPLKGIYVFDLGQNIAGWVRLKVRGERGSVVTMRFGERLNPSGSVYTTNLRSAKCTDTYVLKGGGEEVYEPRFTFHGFQYVEVVGLPMKPDKNTVTGCVVHSATPPVGTFECSNAMVNKLVRNIHWGQRGNFISIPTDCPQRDERLGWMGDAQIFIRTATFNRDVAAFFTKWTRDIVDAQSEEGAFADFSPRIKERRVFEAAPGWGDAGVIVPWTIYKVYGDTRIIETHFAAMEKWMDFLLKYNPDFLRRNRLNNNYGDWLSINADTPKDLLATAYWAADAKMMAEMARAIGREEDAGKYEELFENIRRAFRKEYVASDGRVYPVTGFRLKERGMDASGTKRSGSGETQTNYLLSLYYDLVPEELAAKAAEHLVEDIRKRDWHLSTGFIGVRHLNPVLSATGHNDVAYRLLLNDTFPSWGYSIKHGATTIWERWDGWTEERGFQDPGMNSFNHYSLGSVGEWLYRFVAGIQLDPEVPGYRRIVIHPYPDEKLGYARASYRSINGYIRSGWYLKDGRSQLDVEIPPNTTATVYVPSDEGAEVKEGGVPAGEAECVEFLRYEDGCAVFSVGSGVYRFTAAFTR